uniref:Proteoglycan 4-like n=1 Tax=Panagrellus redivivus TaxID=6233 RepID=A0A7E4VWL8_PANRE
MMPSPDAPPSKVTVTAEHSEIPRPISPPAQIEDIHPTTSPPLPALLKKKMDDSNDNPFRPQEKLFHEVDPIVEAYRNRPYPPSPAGSPIPHDTHPNTTVTTTHDGHQTATTTTTKSTKVTADPSGNGQTVVTEVHTYTTVSANEATPLQSATTTPAKSAAPYVTEPDAALLQSDLPPPGKVELVHIEKKKRCGCCSVQ